MEIELQVQNILKNLKELVNQIYLLRQQSADIEKGMKEVKQRYDEALGGLNTEAERLEVLRYSLRARLQEVQVTIQGEMELPVQPLSDDNFVGQQINATPLDDIVNSLTETPLSLEDTRRHRKLKLIDHVFSFADPSQDNIIKVMNAILVDESTDIGEMLESLAWGEIWSARAEWESVQEQYQRLLEWKQALKDRIVYWEAIIQNLEHDSCYALWIEWKKGENQWNLFLKELVQKQEVENKRLSKEVSILEDELHSKQLESGDSE